MDVKYVIHVVASFNSHFFPALNRVTCAVVLIAHHSTETKSYNQWCRAGYKYTNKLLQYG